MLDSNGLNLAADRFSRQLRQEIADTVHHKGIREMRRLLIPLAVLILHPTIGSAATMSLNGSVSLSTLGEVIFTTLGGTQARTYQNINSGSSTATSISGFASLAGVSPSDITTAYGDLETISTTYTPSGCTPVAGVPSANCATAIITRGENDGSTVPFTISRAGVGTILTGTFISLTTTVITDTASPNFGAGITVGQIQILGGLAPYVTEAFALTGGTGRVGFASSPTSPSCGTPTCVQNTVSELTFAPPPTPVPSLMPVGLILLALGGIAVPALARKRSS